MANGVRVLSIDGGGVRGYIPALIMKELELRADRPASALFDMMCGTSTGGIIAIGLASGIPAATLADFYPTYGRRIFGGVERGAVAGRVWGSGATLGESLGGAARRAGAWAGGNPDFGGNARHTAHGLEEVLSEVLGERNLSDALVDLAITSFDGSSGVPIVLTRREARESPEFDLPLHDVARATSAAPTYFPPFERTWAGADRRFIDGGVWANNPAAVAILESLTLTAAQGLTGISEFLVSLGTGAAPSGAMFDGGASWIGGAGDVIKTATSVLAGEMLAARALPPSNYLRIQVVDPAVAGAMDDPSDARLEALRSAALEAIATHSAELDRAVSVLTDAAPPARLLPTAPRPDTSHATPQEIYDKLYRHRRPGS